MVCYQITIFVTKEQENAIIGLFAERNWLYKKTNYDIQPHHCFSPNSQSQGTPKNLSQELCADLDHVDVKPEISRASIYAGPDMVDTCSMLARNNDPFTNSFPSLNTDEKKCPNNKVNKTLVEAELRTDLSSDNNLEAIEVEDHLNSKVILKTEEIFETSDNLEKNTRAERRYSSEVGDLNKYIKIETETAHQDLTGRSPQAQEMFETFKTYVEARVKDMLLDSYKGQEVASANSCLTEAIYESPVKLLVQEHNSNNQDLAQKNVHCVYQTQNKASILQNFSVASYDSDEDITSFNLNDSYSKSLETTSFNQLEFERDFLLKKNSLRTNEVSKLNAISDMILTGQNIDISNNINKDKATEACDSADKQVARGIKSSENLEDSKGKQVKQPADISKAKKSAYIYCSECKHSFRYQKRYEDHLKYDNCAHMCEFCGKIILYHKTYKRHLKYHNQKNHKCHICGKLFFERSKMLHHEKRHSCPNPEICEVCGLGFPSVTAVNMHKYNMHNDNRQKQLCPKCPKAFSSKAGLVYHIRTTHSKNKIETCNICNKTFNDIKILKAHMIIHVESFDHKCDICNATFKRSSSLYQHKRRHKKAYSHFCKFCQKGFYNSTATKEHENLHTGAKPFVCSVCEYSCASRANLFTHVKLVHKNKAL